MIPLSHHAVLVRADEARAIPLLERELGIAFSTTADPDIAFSRHELFGIDEVRALSARAYQRPIARPELRLIVVAQSITAEAQNALLKLTEDPPPHARFVFVVPHSLPILPTFRSRCTEWIESTVASVEDPFKGTIGEVIERIAKMAKDGDERGMESMLRFAEAEIHDTRAASAAYAEAVMRARAYIETRGASVKMLLEDVAISRASARRGR